MVPNTPHGASATPRVSASLTSQGSILTSLIRLTESSDLDVKNELYNEALDRANDSDLVGARARLQVLLGLFPSDGEAHLLLARVHVAAQQWRLATIELQQADDCGAEVPPELYAQVERNLQAESSWAEDRSAKEDRENGELKKLRNDARRLRTENAHVAARSRELEKEATRWAWVATGTSIVAILFILGRMMIGGADTPEATTASTTTTETAAVAVATTAPAATATAATAAPSIGPIRNEDLAKLTNDALTAAGLADGLKVVVRGSSAQITGSAGSFKQIRDAIKAVQGVPGVEKVAADSVVNKAERDGTTHTVRPGDSLAKISWEYYGKDSLHDKILAANPQLGGKPNLKVGAAIAVPALED